MNETELTSEALYWIAGRPITRAQREARMLLNHPFEFKGEEGIRDRAILLKVLELR